MCCDVSLGSGPESSLVEKAPALTLGRQKTEHTTMLGKIFGATPEVSGDKERVNEADKRVNSGGPLPACSQEPAPAAASEAPQESLGTLRQGGKPGSHHTKGNS